MNMEKLMIISESLNNNLSIRSLFMDTATHREVKLVVAKMNVLLNCF